MDDSSIIFSSNNSDKNNEQNKTINTKETKNTFLSGIFNSGISTTTDGQTKGGYSMLNNDNSDGILLDSINLDSTDNVALTNSLNSYKSLSNSLSLNSTITTQNFNPDRMIESDQDSSSENDNENNSEEQEEEDGINEHAYSRESNIRSASGSESESESLKQFKANIHSLDDESENANKGKVTSNNIFTKKPISLSKDKKSNLFNNKDTSFLYDQENSNKKQNSLFKKNLNDHRKSSVNNGNLQGSFLFRKKSTWPTTFNDSDDLESNNNNNNNQTKREYETRQNQHKAFKNNIISLSKKEKALWKWANIENLDLFLIKVYNYYLGSGFQCILMEKLLNLFTLIFIIFVGSYSTNCISYSNFHDAQKLQDILVQQCFKNSMSNSTKALIYICGIYVVLKIITIYNDYKELIEIHDFYNYLLEIDDLELQTISWQNIVIKIMSLKDSNALTANVNEIKAKNRINAHDIANRIMRKENYLIALFNSDVLDLDLNIDLPFKKSTLFENWKTINLSSNLTKTLEWNINLCILGYAFNEQGYLKHFFLKKSQKNMLATELRKRFMVAGFLNIILSPILVCYFLLLYFFRYFNEYKTTPGAISTRQYTLKAEWQLREYNELYHMFQKRLGLSIEIADDYVNQFPNELKNLVFKFVAFITGSFVAILATFTLFFDSENFLNFEITKEKSVLFYLSIFGTVYAVCKNSISDQYKIFDPELYMGELINYTHYYPSNWEERLHTQSVRDDFCRLYDLKIIVLFKELSSLILTPFILWFKLPDKSDEIVDFFRNSSIYVDGLGYVCKYAVFDDNNDANHPNEGVSSRNGDRPLKKRERQQGMREILEKRFETDNNDQQTPNNKSSTKKRMENIQEESDLFENYDNSKRKNGNEQLDEKIMQSYIHFVDNYSNQENNVGKTAIPRNVELNRNYSWKKQFGWSQSLEKSRLLTQNNKLQPVESLSPNSSAHHDSRFQTHDNVRLKQNDYQRHLKRGAVNDSPSSQGTRNPNQLAESDSFFNQSSTFQAPQSSTSTNTFDIIRHNHTNEHDGFTSDRQKNVAQSEMSPETNTKGVLGLLKQYYKETDVGR